MSPNQPVALITGTSGQDGWYLNRLLLEKGYEVHGIVAAGGTHYVDANVFCHHADLGDGSNLEALLDEIEPDEIYNLAAQSDVRLSFDLPLLTADVTGLGTLRMLESLRHYRDRSGRDVRFYQASSSEMFGKVTESPQNEETPFHPRSPYACAKAFAYWQTVNYREAYSLFASNGILFNHESPRRGENFVTRKITRAATRIKLGLAKTLRLGNLDSHRDWGFAGDYVEAMWRILQHGQPDDFVIATGQTHSVREFLEQSFAYLDLDWQEYVETDPRLLRPAEVDMLRGDCAKAKRVLGWEPRVGFGELVRMMVEHDLALAEQELRSQVST